MTLGRPEVIAAAEGGPAAAQREAVSGQLLTGAADLAIAGALADQGLEELPDVVNHPRIQADHTMGDKHPYYPFTGRVI